MKPRYFRVKKNADAWQGRRMLFIRKSPRVKTNVILALLTDVPDRVISWKKGDTFEFREDEVREIK